jgi:hypothetical protein
VAFRSIALQPDQGARRKPWCIKVRVIEYQVDVGGQDAGEMFCLITDLLDHTACPAAQLAAAYPWRWSGSKTS